MAVIRLGSTMSSLLNKATYEYAKPVTSSAFSRPGIGENMAFFRMINQSVNYKHEDLSLDPQDPH